MKISKIVMAVNPEEYAGASETMIAQISRAIDDRFGSERGLSDERKAIAILSSALAMRKELLKAV